MRSLTNRVRWGGSASLACLAVLSLSQVAQAAYYYVDPAGEGEECSRAVPCSLATGTDRAIAGDTVVLQDGIYIGGMFPKNSGTPEAWITFRADDCALPILEGDGEGATATRTETRPAAST